MRGDDLIDLSADMCVCVCVRCVSDNHIGDEGGGAIAEALKTNSTVTTLDLRCECDVAVLSRLS